MVSPQCGIHTVDTQMSPQLESIRTGVGAVGALVGLLAAVAVHVSLQFAKLHRSVVTVGTQVRFLMCIFVAHVTD